MEICKNLAPALFVSHGGGPMPLLNKDDPCAVKMREIAATIKNLPDAIVIISAHWQTQSGFKVTTGYSHPLLFDYSGFPRESYELKYNAKGAPSVAATIIKDFNEAGIPCSGDDKRGYDHGAFIPLMLMFPDANVPIVAMSINKSLDPNLHIRAGKLLAKLRESNIMIIGSGFSFHNFEYLFTNSKAKQKEGMAASKEFNNFLIDTLTSPSLSNEERETRLVRWASAPSALKCHPLGQEEHLIPLHVAFGASKGNPGKHLGTATVMGGFEASFFEIL